MLPIVPLAHDPDRWTWFAAGDQTVAPRRVQSEPHDNSPQRLAFEIGLVVVAPLLFAAVVSVWLGS